MIEEKVLETRGQKVVFKMGQNEPRHASTLLEVSGLAFPELLVVTVE